MTGDELVEEAKLLVLDALRDRRDGLTNQQVAEATGLSLEISNHRGYISWTILQHLIETGKLRKLGKRYVIA